MLYILKNDISGAEISGIYCFMIYFYLYLELWNYSDVLRNVFLHPLLNFISLKPCTR